SSRCWTSPGTTRWAATRFPTGCATRCGTGTWSASSRTATAPHGPATWTTSPPTLRARPVRATWHRCAGAITGPRPPAAGPTSWCTRVLTTGAHPPERPTWSTPTAPTSYPTSAYLVPLTGTDDAARARQQLVRPAPQRQALVPETQQRRRDARRPLWAAAAHAPVPATGPPGAPVLAAAATPVGPVTVVPIVRARLLLDHRRASHQVTNPALGHHPTLAGMTHHPSDRGTAPGRCSPRPGYG